MISNHSNSRRRVLTIFNHSLELCDKLINCFTFLFTPIPEFESFKRSVFPRSTIIFEFLQHQVKLLFIFLRSKFKGVTDFRAVFPMQCKKSPLAFLHLAARLRSLSNTVQIIASNASNSRLISFQTQSTRGLNWSIDSPFTATTLSHLLLSTPLLQPPWRLSTQRARAKTR